MEARVSRPGVGEDALQISDIIGGVIFHQGGGLDGGQQRGLDLGRVEQRPMDIVHGPALFVDGRDRHDARLPDPISVL